MAKIFLSYRRAEPDQAVVAEIHQHLQREGHYVFRDVDIPVGVRWAEAIQQQLRECDVFIVFLSEHSMDRDMVREEVKQAYLRYRAEAAMEKKLLILPVRLKYEGALPYDMSGWLEPLQYALWKEPPDTVKIAGQLLAAIDHQGTLPHQRAAATADDRLALLDATEAKGRPLPKAEPVLDVIGMRAGSPFYVEREADGQFISSLAYDHGVATICAPKQMGKSSLLAFTRKRLEEKGVKSVFLDLKMLATEPYADAREALLGLALLIADGAKLELDPETFFAKKGFPASKLQQFLSKAFGAEPSRTVLLFDDVDSLFQKPYRDGLFGGLRTVIDQKPNDPGIAKIGFGFAHAHDPESWIKDRNQSPFNVAKPYPLPEFSSANLRWLNEAHGKVLSEAELESLTQLLGGHPYLTRMAFYRLAQREVTLADLFREAATDEGLFGDHLRSRLMQILRLNLATAFKKILDAGRCDDIMQFQALQALGLARGESHKKAQARYGIYESYFKGRLDG
jgi:hypothetical protein